MIQKNEETTTTTTTEFKTTHAVETRQDKIRINELKKQLERVVSDYHTLQESFDIALLLKESHKKLVLPIARNRSLRGSAIPIIQFSDWHVGELIERETTMGRNMFNPEICKQRVVRMTDSTLALIQKEKQAIGINELFLCLGGDFINNYLHEENPMMNTMSPVEELTFAKELLKYSIDRLLNESFVLKMSICCIRGNHGRTTRRMQSSNDYRLSFEALLYQTLKLEYKNDSRVVFYIPESEIGVVELFDKKIRCFHGHQVQYMGGVGDLTIPLNKLIMKWDKTERCDWNLMSHFHSFWMPTRNTSLNGCLCGWNSYALSRGFPFEAPTQTFQLLDRQKGFTVRVPIICE